MPFREVLKAHLNKMEQCRQGLIVPEIPKGLDWYNSPPLSIYGNLKGKIVVLDFWTYCCINCMHVLPDLAALGQKYTHDPVVFLGIHSAKFPNEKESNNVRQAILRYDIHHPVVNDPDMYIWNHLGVRSWPTLVVLGPHANVIFSASGEGHKESLEAFVDAALDYYADALNYQSTARQLEKERDISTSSLRFPGKLAVDPESECLFISDSTNHRILATTFDGRVLDIIGSSQPGFKDGTYQEAQFNRLQGLAYHQQKLYVADAENHAIREVDLKTKRVKTLAGNGIRGIDYRGGNPGTTQPLSTPWDLAVSPDGDCLYVTMAGTHQIWIHEFKMGRTRNLSGSGTESHLNSNNPLLAAWSQPSGITVGDGCLYLADSESSSIRMIDLHTHQTSTLIGGGEEPSNLFCFGDQDGAGAHARLQHPLGVIWWESEKKIIVADTYNHRIKLVDPITKTVRSWIGSGKAGHQEGHGLSASLYEPSGFAWHPNQTILFTADTNNHAIRLIDVQSESISTLPITFG